MDKKANNKKTTKKKQDQKLHRANASTPKGRKKKKKKGHKLRNFFLVLLIIIAAALVYMVAGGYAQKLIELHSEAVELVNDSTPSTFMSANATVVYDSDDDVIAELGSSKDIKYVASEEIPDQVKQAFVSIEDKRFYSHHGVDPKGIMRALVAMVRNGQISGGGSTITQQLARNVFLTQDKTWERKIEEAFIALGLEQKYTKDQILTYYINNVYYMNNYYGIGAAAEGYFNKEPSELTLGQIAYLCAIPNSPTYYDPVENPENTKTRQELILSEMLEDGVIDDAAYTAAVAEDMVLDRQTDETPVNNYQTTYARYCAAKAIMEMNGFDFQYDFASDEEEEAYNDKFNEAYDEATTELYSGGYEIYTSLDMDLQDELQSAIDTTLSGFTNTTDDGIYQLQSAAVTIDNETGMVVAIVGGRSQDSVTGYTLNRAYQSYRQPGSTFKPIAVYAPALENGYTPTTMVRDYKFEDGPKNVNDTYYGNVTLTAAVQQSMNTVAWQVFEDITPEVGLSYIKNMHFEKIVDEDYTLAASLGGLTYGASAVEMAKGFATLANGGNYREPSCITQIIDHTGNTIYAADNSETRIYTQEAADEMTGILETVMTNGTGKNLQLDDQPSAGKTGTTNDNKDGWFVGYTPYYTTSVWVGCDTPTVISGLSGSTYPGYIWQTYMQAIHENLPVKQFDVDKISSESVTTEEEEEEPEEETPEEETTETETPTETPSENVDNTTTNPTDETITNGGSTGGDTGSNTGGDTGGNTGGDTGGSTGGTGETGTTE